MKAIFLTLGLLAAACGAMAQSYNPLHIPDTLSGSQFTLNIYDTTHTWYANSPTHTMGFNGDFWGPTLFINKGANVQMTVVNTTGDSTTVHWHGMHLPAIMDGGPHQIILPGTTWSPHWTMKNSASTYWYHPHLHMMTEDQLIHGLGGFMIVRDSVESALNLPRTYGVDDVPLALSDRTFAGIITPGVENHFATNHYGDTAMVNGTLNAEWQAPAQWVRFRLLNAATERFYNIGFSDNRTFYIITSDGGLLDAPVPVTRYILGVGERIEILVNLTGQNGQSVDLMAKNSELTNGVPGFEPYTPTNPNPFSNKLGHRDFNLVHVSIGAQTANPVTSMPATLANNTYWQASQATNTRRIVMSNPPGNLCPTPGCSWLDGQFYDENRIDQTIAYNGIEIWSLKDSTNVSHPFHIHDVEFHILDVNGQQPAPEQQGWKDVVKVNVNDVVRFIAKFEDYADSVHPYMYHCHIAFHEDAGMMGQFVVKPTAAGIAKAPTLGENSVYPNPSTGKVRIASMQTFKNITVYNTLLQEVYSTTVAPSTQAEIDLSKLAHGLYYIKTDGQRPSKIVLIP